MIDKIFSMEWIKERRKQLGYSQDDLATALQLAGFDVMRATVSHWETKRFAPPLGNPDFVNALARILRMDPLTVLRESGYQVRTSHSDISERVAHLVDSLPEDRQLLALRLVEQLTDPAKV